MAARDAPQGERATTPEAVTLDGLQGIGRTGRLETTVAAEKGRKKSPVPTDHPDGDPGHHTRRVAVDLVHEAGTGASMAVAASWIARIIARSPLLRVGERCSSRPMALMNAGGLATISAARRPL